MMQVRYPLSLRNVEDLWAERGIDTSHETVRFWWNRFGPMFAAEIRKKRHEGEVLEAVVTAKRGNAAALKLLKRIMKKFDRPRTIVTDGLRAYSAAMKEVGNADRQEVGGRLNNRAENSHQPFRRREPRHAALSKYEDAAEAQLSSRSGPPPFQSGAPYRHPSDSQTETLGRIGGVARPCGVDCHLKGARAYESTNRRCFDNASTPHFE
jgi:transposase-like protein